MFYKKKKLKNQQIKKGNRNQLQIKSNENDDIKVEIKF